MKVSVRWMGWVGWCCTLIAAVSCEEPETRSDDLARCGAADQQLPPGCGDDPKRCNEGLPVLPDVAACVDCMQWLRKLGVAETAFSRCGCHHCALPISACLDSATDDPFYGNAERDALCRELTACGLNQGCASSECYCGMGVSYEDCRRNRQPIGPCAQEVADAAGCEIHDTTCIFNQQNNAQSALGRAAAVGTCLTDPVFMFPGACEGTAHAESP